MGWIYGGFLSAWYLVLGVCFALAFPGHPEPWIAALAFFLFIPSLIASVGGCGEQLIPHRTKTGLQRAFRCGALSRTYALVIGVAAGLVSIVGTVLVFAVAYPFQYSAFGVVILIAGLVSVLALSPFLGLWWLQSRGLLVQWEEPPFRSGH